MYQTMATSIVPNELPESIAKEFSLSEDGQGLGFISRRGLARLCGVRLNAVQSLLKSVEQNTLTNSSYSKGLQTFIGQSFEGDQIPDTLASAMYRQLSVVDVWPLTLTCLLIELP